MCYWTIIYSVVSQNAELICDLQWSGHCSTDQSLSISHDLACSCTLSFPDINGTGKERRMREVVESTNYKLHDGRLSVLFIRKYILYKNNALTLIKKRGCTLCTFSPNWNALILNREIWHCYTLCVRICRWLCNTRIYCSLPQYLKNDLTYVWRKDQLPSYNTKCSLTIVTLLNCSTVKPMHPSKPSWKYSSFTTSNA